MKRLTKIVQSASPSTGIQFRKSAYGKAGVREFLRDVIAMANASVEGPRYIVVGVGFDARGRKHLAGVDRRDFAGKPSYRELAGEFIEPQVRLRYHPVFVDGVRIGVYEIAECRDRPYMMRIDHSETLRRGDAYLRADDRVIKMGRRHLQGLFEAKFREAVSGANIEIGFPGEIIHKDLSLPACDLAELPSAIATAKLEKLIEVKRGARASGSTTMLARLTHARLFGTDSPYEERSAEDLVAELHEVRLQYEAADNHFLFEKHRHDLQLVVYNQGDEPIRDASLSLVMPNSTAFHVATRLPPVLEEGRYIERLAAQQESYPTVTLSDSAVKVAVHLGDIGPGAMVDVFETPLRVCAGTEIAGRRFGIQYSLLAQNLRSPATGKLRLVF